METETQRRLCDPRTNASPCAERTVASVASSTESKHPNMPIPVVHTRKRRRVRRTKRPWLMIAFQVQAVLSNQLTYLNAGRILYAISPLLMRALSCYDAYFNLCTCGLLSATSILQPLFVIRRSMRSAHCMTPQLHYTFCSFTSRYASNYKTNSASGNNHLRCMQTKQTGANVAYKRIQGGIQPDVSLRVSSNFRWKSLWLELRPYGCESKTRLPFRVEEKYGCKKWTKLCKRCLAKPWQHKQYTSVRVQFCKSYYGMRLQFIARTENYIAATKVPIVIVKQGDRFIVSNQCHHFMNSLMCVSDGCLLFAMA